MQKQFIDMDAAPAPYGWLNLFTKGTPAPKPKIDMTREQFLVEAWKQNVLCRNYLESPGSREDLTMLTKAIAREQNCDFNEALDTVLSATEWLPEKDGDNDY